MITDVALQIYTQTIWLSGDLGHDERIWCGRRLTWQLWIVQIGGGQRAICDNDATREQAASSKLVPCVFLTRAVALDFSWPCYTFGREFQKTVARCTATSAAMTGICECVLTGKKQLKLHDKIPPLN